MDRATMQQQMQQSIEQQTNRRNVQFQIVEQRTVTIRDQEVVLTVQEGSDGDGETVRQMFGFFEGRGGPTMLMIMGNADRWDENRANTFIESIR